VGLQQSQILRLKRVLRVMNLLFLDVLIDGFLMARTLGNGTVARLPCELGKVIPERAYAPASRLILIVRRTHKSLSAVGHLKRPA